nr:AraC family transcriptional regulator [Allomuricauda sp.]
MEPSVALTIFSGAAISSGLMMVLYFLLVRNENKWGDLAVGLLFLALVMRLSKSLFSYVFHGSSVVGISFGLLGSVLMGPLLFLYFTYTLTGGKKFQWQHLLHLIIPFVAFILAANEVFPAFGLYVWAGHFLMGYLIVVGYRLVFGKWSMGKVSKWHNSLFYGVLGLWLIFSLQLYISSRTFYIWGILLASLTIYILFFIALRTPMFRSKNRPVVTPKEVKDKIIHALEVERAFVQPGISIAQFSKMIGTPAYLVSNGVKSIYGKSFKDVINSFRIQEITSKLSHIDFAHEKVENLAYDAGFNTSSAFYSAFKKETNMTPRAYQRQQQNKSS